MKHLTTEVQRMCAELLEMNKDTNSRLKSRKEQRKEKGTEAWDPVCYKIASKTPRRTKKVCLPEKEIPHGEPERREGNLGGRCFYFGRLHGPNATVSEHLMLLHGSLLTAPTCIQAPNSQWARLKFHPGTNCQAPAPGETLHKKYFVFELEGVTVCVCAWVCCVKQN